MLNPKNGGFAFDSFFALLCPSQEFGAHHLRGERANFDRLVLNGYSLDIGSVTKVVNNCNLRNPQNSFLTQKKVIILYKKK